MKNQALLMCLLAVTTTYVVECLPIETEDVRESNEMAEERTIVYDPTVDTDFTIKVGDITYFTKNYRELLNEKLSYKESSQGKQKRAVVKPKSWQWPNCVIPYIIDEFYSEKQQRVVTEALAHWEEHTCVRFRKRTTEDNYIFIYPGPGCGSYVGRTSNQQRVSIGPSCFSFSSAVHELGHVIGFYHEHNRPDRDEYIDIFENNLKPGRSVLSQFTKLSLDEVDLLGVGYDYNSIMHYDKNSFAHSSHLDTIVALDPSIPIGEAHTLSSLDIFRANLFCKCSNSTEDHPPRTTFVPDEIVPEPTLPPHEFACGSVFDGVSSGSFSSPDYGVYSHDTDCEWTIRVEEGYRIRFTVELDMDYNRGCVNDYLHIHENFNRNGYGIGKYCQSSDRIINTYTTTNIAYIRFHTDSSNQRTGLKGFNLRFESEDFDECAYGAYCSHNCTNFPGSYECHCPKGFFLSSDHKQCFDVNECALDKGGCDHKCINKGGSFHCVCEDGYRLLSDGKTCVVDGDGTMDPCLIAKCEHSCVVVPGDVLTARCLCPKGYDLSSDRVSCDEENECLTRNGGCQHFCTNIPGSYECSCIKGYKLADNGFACEDADDIVDPCLIANCEHSCEVVPGDVDTARCLCPKGYDLSSNRVSCDEVNECLTRNGGCQDLCTNVPGSYECSCSKGYKLADNGLTCEDDTVDPCLIANCEHSCEVVPGDVDTARCLCPKGYDLSSNRVSCDEVNECLTRNGGCQDLCTNVPGSYECNCSKGYKLADNGLTCEDIDECADNNGGCSGHCTDSDGSYQCFCDSGSTLQPDGHSCTLDKIEFVIEPETIVIETTIEDIIDPKTILLCGGLSTAAAGSIQTPSWPETYPVNFECQWDIQVPSTDCNVELSFDINAFGIAGKSSQNCPKDYLKIYEKLNYTICDLARPSPITTTGNTRLYFFAGPKHGPKRKGFRIEYTIVCPTTPPPTTRPTTVSTTTPYPTTPIPTTRPTTVATTSPDPTTSPPTTRPTTVATVTPGPTIRPTTRPTTTTPPTTLAPTTLPPPTPNCPVLPSNPPGKFACGGFINVNDMFGPTNLPLGPILPGTINPECNWIIFGAGTFKVMFTYFDIPSSEQCSSNSVSVYDGFGTSAPLIEKMCGEKCGEYTVTGTGSILTVTLRVSSPGSFRGFYAQFKQI